jgi:hypothetical protein
MNATAACELPWDAGYSNACSICGAPFDAGYFDVSNFRSPPTEANREVELARYVMHSQYCGVLMYFAQYAEQESDKRQVNTATPGYEWIILCNNQPRAPYLPTSLILSPWGRTAFPVNIRLEEGCVLTFVVRKISPTHVSLPPGSKEVKLSRVGGRLMGRSWYNAHFGGAPARL